MLFINIRQGLRDSSLEYPSDMLSIAWTDVLASNVSIHDLEHVWQSFTHPAKDQHLVVLCMQEAVCGRFE